MGLVLELLLWPCQVLFFDLWCTFLHQGVVLGLCNSFGYIKCCQDPKLVFDLCEVMEETKLSITEKVEFTIVPVCKFPPKNLTLVSLLKVGVACVGPVSLSTHRFYMFH